MIGIGFYLLTEEPSMKEVLDAIMPLILGVDDWYQVIVHQGKNDLQKALKQTVPSLSKIPNARIVILHDQDRNDCKVLKAELNEEMFRSCTCPYKVRIVCKELESWYFGDWDTLNRMYPKLNVELLRDKAKYRKPDEMVSPSKHLLEIVPELEKRQSLSKVFTAKLFAEHFDINTNDSPSFNCLIAGVHNLIEI